MSKHENECAPLRSSNWFGSLIFCPGWLISFQQDRKVKWHGWKWGDRGEDSLQRILNEMRDTEWNVNSRRRLTEWQSTYYLQLECLMRAEKWHLGEQWIVTGLVQFVKLNQAILCIGSFYCQPKVKCLGILENDISQQSVQLYLHCSLQSRTNLLTIGDFLLLLRDFPLIINARK